MPQLFARKVLRMRASSVGFLRGAAPLFYWICAEDVREGPPGEGWIAGDLHVENFGVYRTAPVDLLQRGRAANVTFDLNDFDEAVLGPWRLDVLRLLTSLILAARGNGASGGRTVTLAAAMLQAYVGGAFGSPEIGPRPPPVAKLLARASARTRRALLDARTTKTSRGRRFVRDGGRYVELPASVDLAARGAFAVYAREVQEKYGLSKEHFEVVDTAFRIAGTGSLGTLRIAVLARGKASARVDDGHWIFDMKAQGEPAAVTFGNLPVPKSTRAMVPAERVLRAMERCLDQPPHMASTVRLGNASMLVRRLAPQEDKLNLAQVPDAELESLARYLGALTGAAHRRGALRPARAWTRAACEKLLHRAFELAGVHEAVYLAYVRLTEKTGSLHETRRMRT
ncbi:DUF2252 family protein [Pendulispora albinea]|uniref:DUF2252 domain-containing protein n=1 Tax=Pendulispora albinea TaxID=2741071 RepID=A0ABZ2M806_9BACT